MTEPQYRYKEKICINKGFYKGYYGTIENYKIDKNKIIYEIIANLKDNQTKKLTIPEEDLRKIKRLFKQ